MNMPTRRPCILEGCERPVGKGGGYDMCGMHYQRFRAHGSPHVVARGGAVLRGPDNPNWSGSNATYSAVHIRLRRDRGPARRHLCVDCGNRAAEWSYDHSDPTELADPKFGRYSTSLDKYEPRCVSCHRKFDNAARALLTGERPA